MFKYAKRKGHLVLSSSQSILSLIKNESESAQHRNLNKVNFVHFWPNHVSELNLSKNSLDWISRVPRRSSVRVCWEGFYGFITKAHDPPPVLCGILVHPVTRQVTYTAPPNPPHLPTLPIQSLCVRARIYEPGQCEAKYSVRFEPH